MKYPIVLLASLLLGCGSTSRDLSSAHLVISYGPDKKIERVFRTKAGALDYINAYKQSHEYFYEEVLLKD